MLKIIIAAASIFSIYRQVLSREHFTDVVNDVSRLVNDKGALIMLNVCIILFLINWSIESLKWKFLVSKILPLTFLKSVNAVLTGVTVSFFTPNRVGEFAGRVIHLPEGIRIKASLATFIGNIAQVITTVIFGSYACSFLIFFFEIDASLKIFCMIAITLVNAVLLIFYFNISILDKWLLKIKFLKKYATHFQAFSDYSGLDLLKILLLSILRYIVYAIQYVILLKMMNVGGEPVDLFFAVAIVFIVITVVPSIVITELAVRTSVAVSIIGLLSDNKLGILEASLLLWLINLVIPAVAGSFTLLSIRLSKNR